MIQHKVIIGEFENESYALIAKIDLHKAGIKSNILKERNRVLPPLILKHERVRLAVYEAQFENAKKILEIKFI